MAACVALGPDDDLDLRLALLRGCSCCSRLLGRNNAVAFRASLLGLTTNAFQFVLVCP